MKPTCGATSSTFSRCCARFATLAGMLISSAIAASAAASIALSPGTQVTPQDVASFNTAWMNPDDRAARLKFYDGAMNHRIGWIVWSVADDATAMVRMWEQTHDLQYLSHLKGIADITLKYRDDHHPGDEYPNRNDPECIVCQPPFIDRERGGVQAAWGNGSITGYVSDGGLTPVDAVSSGLYLYPIVAFARIVLEDASLQQQYGTAAVQFASAGIETFNTFASQLDFHPTAAGYIEGWLNRPQRFPSTSECQTAKQLATNYARTYGQLSQNDLAAMLTGINNAETDCERASAYANKPLAHNESGALMLSFVELWRALGGSYYQSVAGTPLVRAVIAFALVRHHRYFVNRLQLVDNPAQGTKYRWNYNDDVPNPHIEDTAHANLDMLYVSILRGSREGLNAFTAPAGEPLPLDDGQVRRFANTFLEAIALPADVDAGANLRSDVDGHQYNDRNASDKTYYNVTTDGWVNAAAVDPTVYRMVRDVAQRQYIQDGVNAQHDLTIANHSALLANKHYSREITNTDLMSPSGAPRAASDPFGWVFAAGDVQDVTYRGIDGHVYELWRTRVGGVGYTNLSASAGAPRAASDPKGYDFPALATHNVVYRGTDGHLHALWWTTGVVGHDDLTTLSGAPLPAGNPFPYVSPPFGVQNVAYRGTDGHLHVLYWSTGAVGHDDITRLSGAPAAAGDPFGYFITTQGLQDVIYRGVDGHLHGLYWGLGAVGHDDLTALSKAPPPSGDATAYETPTGLQTVIYRGIDGHIHGLYWTTGAVGHDDLSENGAPGAALPYDDVEAYFDADDATNHVLYCTSIGHIHELSWTTGAVSHADLSTLIAGVQPSACDNPNFGQVPSRVSGYVFSSDRTQHAVYRADDGHLHDLSWTTPASNVIP